MAGKPKSLSSRGSHGPGRVMMPCETRLETLKRGNPWIYPVDSLEFINGMLDIISTIIIIDPRGFQVRT